ncbi:hypothetical protein DFJ73DRAFT_917774 [Zopfochytrium polystomum]|nr:hypothetical protein DFJ73DRAFT_917774 [Zopfochytrium polystomum]
MPDKHDGNGNASNKRGNAKSPEARKGGAGAAGAGANAAAGAGGRPDTSQPAIKTGIFIFPDGSRYEGGYKEVEASAVAVTPSPPAVVGAPATAATTQGGASAPAAAAPTAGSDVVIVRHGMGRYSCEESTYEGMWDMDKMAGRGRLTFASGATYDGNFHDNRFSGAGTYTWPDGSSLSGDAWDGNRLAAGTGRFVDAGGQAWVGAFHKGAAPALAPELEMRPFGAAGVGAGVGAGAAAS